MNRNKLKTYAPAARREFIQAITDRAKALGLSREKIEPVELAGDIVIIAGRPFPKDVAERRKKLEAQIKLKNFEQVMEEVAYTWFNRFMALRYMELHDYLGHGLRVLSNPSGSDIPEILEQATSVELNGLDREKVAELRLAGDKDAELYKLLLVSQCNALHKVMPFLFEHVSDSSELLLPENLLQTSSPIRKLVNEIPEEDWNEIEIVGWLYQFYISEKKDQVIGKVVKSEDIPAATQLFTPNWIVKYMVQNTLGRKWLMTYPESSIKGKMEFYIPPAVQEVEVQEQLDAITPNELNPEELTFMDPACGSGHILVEAYDLFKEVYLERGYRTREIPRLILEKNLFGLDIDDRAVQLARFAVLMKARADDRRILDPEHPVKLNILSIQESKGIDVDLVAGVLLRERVNEICSGMPQQQYLIQPKISQTSLRVAEKPEVTKEELFSLLNLFKEAKTYGSLLTVHDKLKMALPKFERLITRLKNQDVQSLDLAVILEHLVLQLKILADQYDFVVANPPYMGSKGQNPKLKEYAKDKYPDSKSNLFAMFIERGLDLVQPNSFLSMITMESWMFLSSYEKFRTRIVNNNTLQSLGHFPYDGKPPTVMGINFGLSILALRRHEVQRYAGTYFCSRYYELNDDGTLKEFPTINERYKTAFASDFKKIPGSPIAYWVSDGIRKAFESFPSFSDYSDTRIGLITGDNDYYIRQWHEISIQTFGIDYNREEAAHSGKKWFPQSKGGDFRRWYGNHQTVLDWSKDGDELQNRMHSSGTRTLAHNFNLDKIFLEGITWTKISSGTFGARLQPKGFLFNDASANAFPNTSELHYPLLAILCSKIPVELLKAMNPTLNFLPGNIAQLPIPNKLLTNSSVLECSKSLVSTSKLDWDSYETSWDFSWLPLLKPAFHHWSLGVAYQNLRAYWQDVALEANRMEEENNSIIIEAYELTKDLLREVPSIEITLTCNPYYRYGPGKTEEEYEALLRSDTIKELISYAIGCMMGRYSLDEPGLIYAHSGNKGFDPSCYTTFPADEDGIIPIMDDDWFEDDATNRFVEFLKVAWSPETLDENLKFVADSLEPKRGEAPIETIRRFMSTKFFKDHHLKVYKKRPIYWLFSTGKHKAFECLVYLHRYNEATLSRMRSAYVTPLQGKIISRIEYLKKEEEAATSTATRKQFQKQHDVMLKKQLELRQFDELLRHYADMRISLDLDDGVKVNYGKFGALLAEVKAISGDNAD